MRRAATVVPLVLALLAASCGSKSGNGDPSRPSSPPASLGSTSTAERTATQPTTTPGGCSAVQAPAPRDPGKHRKPTAPLASGRAWALKVVTNCGSFKIALDLRTAPHAAASLVALARAGYFDATLFDRIAPGFVIQAGDPTASGSGGPGYTTVDKPPRNARYTRGVVAMAKTQTEPPGAGGSQFFVVTASDARLPPDYAVVGRVTKGLATVGHIGRLGDSSEQPTEPVVIEKVTVSAG